MHDGLTRTAFEDRDGIARFCILCGACAMELFNKLREADMRYWVKDFGPGKGTCELCSHEISLEVGAAD